MARCGEEGELRAALRETARGLLWQLNAALWGLVPTALRLRAAEWLFGRVPGLCWRRLQLWAVDRWPLWPALARHPTGSFGYLCAKSLETRCVCSCGRKSIKP